MSASSCSILLERVLRRRELHHSSLGRVAPVLFAGEVLEKCHLLQITSSKRLADVRLYLRASIEFSIIKAYRAYQTVISL